MILCLYFIVHLNVFADEDADVSHQFMQTAYDASLRHHKPRHRIYN